MKLRYIFTAITLLFAGIIFGQTAEVSEMGFGDLILGDGVTWTMFLVFLTFGALGLLSSILFDIYSSGTSTKKFSLKYWWKCNKWRLSLSVLAVVIGILFSEQLLSIEMSNWASFLAGFTADKLIESLMQRRRRKTQSASEEQTEDSEQASE